jgi:hypothetical protein
VVFLWHAAVRLRKQESNDQRKRQTNDGSNSKCPRECAWTLLITRGDKSKNSDLWGKEHGYSK